MFTRLNKQNWHLQMGFDLWVDFAVWMLERDGLQVSPFVSYPSALGNRQLSDLGLTTVIWQEWFHRLINRDTSSDETNHPIDLLTVNNSQLKNKMSQYWDFYLPLSNSRRYAEKITAVPKRYQNRNGNNLWQTLQKARGDLPPLNVILIGYPAKIEHVTPPSTLIFAPAGALIRRDELEIILLRNIQALKSLRSE